MLFSFFFIGNVNGGGGNVSFPGLNPRPSACTPSVSIWWCLVGNQSRQNSSGSWFVKDMMKYLILFNLIGVQHNIAQDRDLITLYSYTIFCTKVILVVQFKKMSNIDSSKNIG